MPWKDRSLMEMRSEFVQLVQQGGVTVTELARRAGISRKTAYKWLGRADPTDRGALANRSRRPHRQPTRTDPTLEDAVCALRRAHPAWGGRKLHQVLVGQGVTAPPAASTITDILRRNGLLGPAPQATRAWQRFTAPAPNALWQMDFKGHVPTSTGRCHPLTVLDDYSRFNLCLAACADERATTVQQHLTATFRRYGLPDRILCDNGSPWGNEPARPWTTLSAWLLRLQVGVSHGRPYHPQTQGKDERFHRTLAVEVLRTRPTWPDLASYQTAFSAWRPVYNDLRPHESLGLQPPSRHYRASPRPFPETLPPIEYAPGDLLRHVQDKGQIAFRGRAYRLSRAFRGQPVALRPTATDGVWAVFFCHQQVAIVDPRSPLPDA